LDSIDDTVEPCDKPTHPHIADSTVEPCDKLTHPHIVDDSPVLCQMEHHVVYSRSYSVPMLFFNICKPGGELLSVDELWGCVTSHVDVGQNLWSVITQQEHPLLRRPFFHLHPCHTSELLKQLHPCHSRQSNGELLSVADEVPIGTLAEQGCEAMLDVDHTSNSKDISPRACLVTWLSSVAPLALLQLSHRYADFT